MKAKISASFAFLFACAAAFAAGQSSPTQPVLMKGMEGTAIQQLVGQPTEIQQLNSSDVKAEKWIYRRKLTEGTYQTANTQAYIPALVGVQSSGVVVGQALVPDYRLKFVKVYQVTALLIVDGKLERGRQWTEREESFAD
jgi:hypothetical protein